MAHEIDMSNGRANMAYTGQTPWHGLGHRIEPGQSIDEWRRLAGLDWEALREPLKYSPMGVEFTAGMDALYRSDTGEALGVVSPRYKVVQPSEVLDFFRYYVDKIRAFELETVGALRGGARIWALARAKDDDSGLVLGDDRINRYLLLATSYDRSTATIVQQTSIRVVCNNTLSASIRAGEQKAEPVVRVSHHATFSAETVRERMKFDEQWSTFCQAVTAWARRRVTKDEATKYFREVYAMKDTDSPRSKAAQERNLEKLHVLFRTAPGQQTESAYNTAWGLVNLVTFDTDHNVGDDPDTRLDAAWFGQRQYRKQKAVRLAQALVQ